MSLSAPSNMKVIKWWDKIKVSIEIGNLWSEVVGDNSLLQLYFSTSCGMTLFKEFGFILVTGSGEEICVVTFHARASSAA